jgi:hypothetical protein
MQEIVISKSTRPDKKFQATSKNKTIFFGQKPYEDYTMNHSESRKKNYIKRHGAQQNWSKSNVFTPGFLARHVLWEAKTVQGAIQKLNKKYKDVSFKLK